MNTRRFRCPFCSYTKNFYGTEAKRFRKRVSGFTCPSCGKKVTDDDIKRKRGGGPKPPGKRRKRVKKEVVKKTSKFVVHPNVEQFAWRTGGPPPPGEPRGYRGRAGWQPKPRQPTERTLEEAILLSSGIKPSAPIPKERDPHEEEGA